MGDPNEVAGLETAEEGGVRGDIQRWLAMGHIDWWVWRKASRQTEFRPEGWEESSQFLQVRARLRGSVGWIRWM